MNEPKQIKHAFASNTDLMHKKIMHPWFFLLWSIEPQLQWISSLLCLLLSLLLFFVLSCIVFFFCTFLIQCCKTMLSNRIFFSRWLMFLVKDILSYHLTCAIILSILSIVQLPMLLLGRANLKGLYFYLTSPINTKISM